MKNKILKIALVVIGVVGIGMCASFLPLKEEQKVAYVNMDKLFLEFEGTKERSKEVTFLQERHKKVLDSLNTHLKIWGIKERESKKFLQEQLFAEQVNNSFAEDYQKKVSQYDAELWSQISDFVQQYGKENKYDLIHGLKGDGNILYANDQINITTEVVTYINKKYQGE